MIRVGSGYRLCESCYEAAELCLWHEARTINAVASSRSDTAAGLFAATRKSQLHIAITGGAVKSRREHPVIQQRL